MRNEPSSRAVKLAGLYLYELLLNTYNHQWVAKSDRIRPNKVNVMGVARVLAEYVETHPTASHGYGTEAEQIKDTVYRMLNGSVLTQETLQLVINAFDVGDAHAATLIDLWMDTAPARVLVGNLSPLNVPHASLNGVQRFQTTQRHEFHTIGPNGKPIQHRTVQNIRALVDGYDTHRYSFDTNAAKVERVHGGTPGDPYQLRDSIWAVDIALPRVLNAGDMVSMEFITSLFYPDPVPPVMRYAAHQRVEDVLYRVQFHSERLPRTVWWTEWRDYREPNDEIIYRESISLDSEYSVERYLDVLERAVVGFSWEF